jgi:hypothetical protein
MNRGPNHALKQGSLDEGKSISHEEVKKRLRA